MREDNLNLKIILMLRFSVWWVPDAVLALNPYSAGIDFSRQILTFVDVRFWRLKSIHALQD